MHFFVPAEKTALVEIVKGSKSSGRTVASAFQIIKSIGKIPVLVGNSPGFVANRMGAHYFHGPLELVHNHGFLPHEVDGIMLNFGFPLGPFQMLDSVGIVI